MIWWIVATLAAIYLLLRLVQMAYWFVTRFLLAAAIPLPVKVVVLLAMAGLGGGTWLWLRRRAKGAGPRVGGGDTRG